MGFFYVCIRKRPLPSVGLIPTLFWESFVFIVMENGIKKMVFKYLSSLLENAVVRKTKNDIRGGFKDLVIFVEVGEYLYFDFNTYSTIRNMFGISRDDADNYIKEFLISRFEELSNDSSLSFVPLLNT